MWTQESKKNFKIVLWVFFIGWIGIGNCFFDTFYKTIKTSIETRWFLMFQFEPFNYLKNYQFFLKLFFFMHQNNNNCNRTNSIARRWKLCKIFETHWNQSQKNRSISKNQNPKLTNSCFDSSDCYSCTSGWKLIKTNAFRFIAMTLSHQTCNTVILLEFIEWC